jgi:hypothetical protein
MVLRSKEFSSCSKLYSKFVRVDISIGSTSTDEMFVDTSRCTQRRLPRVETDGRWHGARKSGLKERATRIGIPEMPNNPMSIAISLLLLRLGGSSALTCMEESGE